MGRVDKALAYSEQDGGCVECDQVSGIKYYKHGRCGHELGGDEWGYLVVPGFCFSGNIKTGEACKTIYCCRDAELEF